MQYISEMTKMTLKLLLRSKGFLFFAIALPMLASLILNISSADNKKEDVGEVTVLENENVKMAYMEEATAFPIKVYNSSNTKESKELVEKLAEASMFQVFEVDSRKLGEKEIMESAKNTATHDKVDAILLIKAGYKEGNGAKEIELYQVGNDERYEFLEEYLGALLTKEQQLTQAGEELAEEKRKITISQQKGMEEKSIFQVDVDSDKTTIFGNTLALYSAAFLFAGIIILGTIVTEKDNRVYTRILLSNAGPYSYITSKFIVIVISAIIETISATISYGLFVKTEVALTIPQFMVILFGMALIFNSLSVGVGICCGNTLTACLTAFSCWALGSLLGGLYFDISQGTKTFLRVATLMPQRWGLKVASLFMNGDNTGYPLIIIVTITYVIVVLLIGVLGLRLTRKE